MQNYIKALTAQGEAASCSGTSSPFSRDALPELNQLLTAMDQAQLIPSHPYFTHLHVIQQPLEVQTPLGSIPVAVGSDIFKPSIHKYRVVVL